MTQEEGLKLLQYNVTKYTNSLYRIVTSVYKFTACTSAKIARCFFSCDDQVWFSSQP